MRAFLTGSRVYGSPTPDSDIDLVAVMSELDYNKLALLADNADSAQISEYGSLSCTPLRFGKLNLICCLSDEEAAGWLVGTASLTLQKKKLGVSSTREQACAMFSKLRGFLKGLIS